MGKEFNSWDEIDLKMELLRGIYAYGFDNPSTIQKKGILPFIEGKDIIAQSQSGTGKTGAFVVSSLQIITDEPKSQVIILAPVNPTSVIGSKTFVTDTVKALA